MLDYETQRKLIVIFIMGCIITIIATIVAIIVIWIPEKETTDEKEFQVGKIEIPDVSEEEIIKKYYEELYIMFLNADVDAIAKLVGKDYLEYFELDEQDIKDMLREKNMLSKGLELVQYRTFFVDGYSNVYELDLKVKDHAYSINLVIREISPNNYTIAFDKFIDVKEDSFNFVKESVELNINKQIRYTNSIQYEFELVNRYNKNVIINSGGSANPIFLMNSQGTTRRPIMTTLSTAEITLTPNEERAFTAAFKIEDTYDFYTYITLVVKNVQFEGHQGVNNLELVLK